MGKPQRLSPPDFTEPFLSDLCGLCVLCGEIRGLFLLDAGATLQ